jgi:uncharacterized membrane protein YebE (DUF533 family)
MKELDIKLTEELSKLLEAVRAQEQVVAIINRIIADADNCMEISYLSELECAKYGITQESNLSVMLGMFRQHQK